MKYYTLPDTTVIDLKRIESVSRTTTHTDRSDENYYIIHMRSGNGIRVYEDQLPREQFVSNLMGIK